MKIAVGCDHRGYEGKKKLIPALKRWGHDVRDLGCDSIAACDYPDIAADVARLVASGACDVGILLDGSGIGMSIAANKIRGIRAALVHDEVTARLAREANHSNVLCIGTDLLGEDHLRRIAEIFLKASFVEGRHLRRVNKIHKLELEAPQEAAHARPLAKAAEEPHARPPSAAHAPVVASHAHAVGAK